MSMFPFKLTGLINLSTWNTAVLLSAAAVPDKVCNSMYFPSWSVDCSGLRNGHKTAIKAKWMTHVYRVYIDAKWFWQCARVWTVCLIHYQVIFLTIKKLYRECNTCDKAVSITRTQEGTELGGTLLKCHWQYFVSKMNYRRMSFF